MRENQKKSKKYKFEDPELHQVMEPLVAMGYTTTTLMELTPYQQALLSEKGIPSSILGAISEKLKLNIPTLAKIFQMSEKTLRNKLNTNNTLKPFEADMALALLQLHEEGLATFENPENFLSWMNSSWEALNFRKPVEMLHSKSSVDFLIQELKSIRHGIFS